MNCYDPNSSASEDSKQRSNVGMNSSVRKRSYRWLFGLVEPKDFLVHYYITNVVVGIFLGFSCTGDIGGYCPSVFNEISSSFELESLLLRNSLILVVWGWIISSLLALLALRIAVHKLTHTRHMDCRMAIPCNVVFLFVPTLIYQVLLITGIITWACFVCTTRFNHLTTSSVESLLSFGLFTLFPVFFTTIWLLYAVYGCLRSCAFYIYVLPRRSGMEPRLIRTDRYVSTRPKKTRFPILSKRCDDDLNSLRINYADYKRGSFVETPNDSNATFIPDNYLFRERDPLNSV